MRSEQQRADNELNEDDDDENEAGPSRPDDDHYK